MTLVARLESCNYRPKKVGGPCTNYKVPTVSQIQMYEQEQVHTYISNQKKKEQVHTLIYRY